MRRPEWELIALAVTVSIRCDGGTAVHTEAAIKHGATQEKIAEALGVAVAPMPCCSSPPRPSRPVPPCAWMVAAPSLDPPCPPIAPHVLKITMTAAIHNFSRAALFAAALGSIPAGAALAADGLMIRDLVISVAGSATRPARDSQSISSLPTC